MAPQRPSGRLRKQAAALIAVAFAMAPPSVRAERPRIEISMVASQAAWVYANRLADDFVRSGPYARPSLEASETAIQSFCAAVGLATPDAAVLARALTASEAKACRAAGVTPVEVMLGTGPYPLSYKVRLIVKREHIGLVPGLADLLREAEALAREPADGAANALALIPPPAPGGIGAARGGG